MEKTFIQLVRLGIGHRADAPINVVDWNQIKTLAERQGLSAIVVDGIERLPESQRPPKDIILEWIGEVLQGYEYRYDAYEKTIADMAGFYNSHRYKMMVLKGYSCSLDWPKPNHRPCGDIDIWQFRDQQEADAIIEKEKGIKIDNSHHHHSVYYWGDWMVENHYDFINTHAHSSSAALEKEFKALGKDDTHYVIVNGEKVYLPSPNLHALFLLRHTMNHFGSYELTFRQLLDWAFVVEKHKDEIDWEWFEKMIDRFGMTTMFNIFNTICVEDLGFDASIFPPTHCDLELKKKVYADIFSPGFSEEEPSEWFPRAILRYRRWKANEWKQRLCYNESRWVSFWRGIISHILKPASI